MEVKQIAVIGLGYVGLPLAIEFAKKYKVVGYDINKKRIEELSKGIDQTKETSDEELSKLLDAEKQSAGVLFSNNADDLIHANVYVITVPTPVNESKIPDLSLLFSATETVAKYLKKNDVVIYESTVYPGCTEEECVPILEKISGLKINTDFFCGYSPERISPGDKKHTLTSIQKITSGSSPEAADFVDELYTSIISAGTFKASSIKIAEAAKAIENAQRDVNISFVNELSLIFDKMNIDTYEVLEAAATKWNFINFKPGLVGGHCIGVDPYYLTFKAKQLGHTPQVISSGREVNEAMGGFVADKVCRLIKNKFGVNSVNDILILGITFKEDCPDIRNTGVLHLYESLEVKNAQIDVYDTWASPSQVKLHYGISLLPVLDYDKKYAAVILAVSHENFNSVDIKKFKDAGAIIFDIKGVLPKHLVDGRL